MGAAGSDKVDALEDRTGAFLWQWEVREQKSLPKAHRPAAGQHKKQMHKVTICSFCAFFKCFSALMHHTNFALLHSYFANTEYFLLKMVP